MENLEEEHERFITNKDSELRQEMAELGNNIQMEAVSSVYLVLRIKEGGGHWLILFVKMCVTIT